jgi:hypothetical protein
LTICYKGLAEGLAEGKEMGLMEAKTEIVKRLLADKEFAIKKIATIAGVSVAFVKTIKSTLIHAPSQQ